MPQIALDSGSNKKWLVVLGLGLSVVALLSAWWAGQSSASGRVADTLPALAQTASAQSEADKMASNPAAAAMLAQQAEAAKELERTPDMQPIVGPVTARPAYVSQMEWAMLQGVAQQQTYPDKELTRMVNFLRFTKQMELLEALANRPEAATKRQTLAWQLIDDLPTRVANGELELKDAQGKLTAFLADAVSDPHERGQREEAQTQRLLAANDAYKAAEKIPQP